jgi:hypothetical protein
MSVAALRAAGDDLLRDCLRRALAETGERRTVTAMARRRFAYETSFAIDELDVRFDDGSEVALVVKDVGEAGLSPDAAAAKPRFTLDPSREIEVYLSLLAPAGLSAPYCHGAAVDPDLGRAWIFLERVDGEVLTDVGDLAAWRQAAAWAGRLDTAVGPSAGRLCRHLLDRDERWHAHWIGAAAAASAARGDEELSGRLRDAEPALLERLASMPRSFLHGELYPSNVLVAAGGRARCRIAPVDWELAGTGPFALDLAALVSGWGRDDRLSMCAAFHQSLSPTRRETTSLDALSEAVSVCELALALQWIGWSPAWVAPAAHRRDWPKEAERLLGEVGL